jgi:hypothetical protein
LPRGTSLGLHSPATTCNRQQEKQHSTVKKAQVGDSIAARNTHVGWNHIKSREHPKDQREYSADQA